MRMSNLNDTNYLRKLAGLPLMESVETVEEESIEESIDWGFYDWTENMFAKVIKSIHAFYKNENTDAMSDEEFERWSMNIENQFHNESAFSILDYNQPGVSVYDLVSKMEYQAKTSEEYAHGLKELIDVLDIDINESVEALGGENPNKVVSVEIDHMGGHDSAAKKYNITLEKIGSQSHAPGMVGMYPYKVSGKKQDLQKYLAHHYDGHEEAKEHHPEVFHEVSIEEAYDDEVYNRIPPNDEMSLDDFQDKRARRKKSNFPARHGDNPLAYSNNEETIFETLMNEFEEFQENAPTTSIRPEPRSDHIDDIRRETRKSPIKSPRPQPRPSGVNEMDLPLDTSGGVVGWIAMFNGKKIEIKKGVDADSLYGAKMFAAKELRVPKSKMGLLAIAPAVAD